MIPQLKIQKNLENKAIKERIIIDFWKLFENVDNID